MKTIGVVAGAGPYAGQDLLKKLFEQTLAVSDQEHLDVIGLFRPSAMPDRTNFLLNPNSANPGIAIAQQVLELERMGAKVAGIPCNTAHAALIYDCMQSELKAHGAQILFLNMIEETVNAIRAKYPGLARLGVLSTTGSYRVNLYLQYLQKAGLRTVAPDENIQHERVHAAIVDPQYGIKALGGSSERARQDLLFAAEHLMEKGAQGIILGCTEIPLALQEASINGIPLIDPTLILARALIREAAPEKLKPEA